MSRPDARLILSPQAENDFADILQYTLETWGDAQMLAYRTVLHQALLSIRDDPKIGPLRMEISGEHRVIPAGQHIIIYRLVDTAVHVSRILHGRMDLRRHTLSEEE